MPPLMHLCLLRVVPQALGYIAYPGFNAHAGHGGVEIDSDATAPTRLSMAACEARCENHDECDCTTYRPSDGKCWMRKVCVPGMFSRASGFDTYVKKATPTAYTLYSELNAHQGHGAVELDDDATAPVGLSVAACEARCDQDAFCGCVTFRIHDGKCWKRADCVSAEFSTGRGLDTYVKDSAPRAFDWIQSIAGGSGGVFDLDAQTYYIDKQYQLPTGTEIHGVGAGGNGTVIRAVGEPFNRNCGSDAKNRKGFLLGDHTYIGKVHFVGMETARYDCLTAPFETPGCANSQTPFTEAPNENQCGGKTGIGRGIQNATVEDITVEAFTTQNVFFMTPTVAGANVSHDITVRRIACNGTWADGINIHGQHYNVLVEGCSIRYSGDDSYATWSVGADQTNISFVNNYAFTPHQGGGPHCAEPHPPRYCPPSGCFANYGGQSSFFLNNTGTECYKDAVVIYGNVKEGLFGGKSNASSSIVARGNVGMKTSCNFILPFPGHIDCERNPVHENSVVIV